MFKLHNRLHSVGYLLEKSLKMVYIYSGKEKKEKHVLDALLKNAKKKKKNIYILLFFFQPHRAFLCLLMQVKLLLLSVCLLSGNFNIPI